MPSGYWEIYDDQTAEDFTFLSYTDLSGKEVRVDIAEDLETQVHEIRRANGMDTEIRIHKE